MTRVIGIISGKGGVGKTTFATNLGIALRSLGKRVVVVDCNITTPHLAYYLGARDYSVTLNDVFRNEVKIGYAPTYHGVMFIPASGDIRDITKIDIRDLKKHIHKLSAADDYDFIILDSAPGLGKEAIATLQACNEIIFVTTPTIPTIRDITRCAEVANSLGHRRFNIVLNMVRNKNFELREKEAENLFRTPILGTIPFDENVMDSTAQGIPMLFYKPDSPVCYSYMKLAANLTGIQFKKPSVFKRIWRRLTGR